MIDLHTHSLLSDGALLPAELVRRAEALGLLAIAITDHGDDSNLDFIVPRVVEICRTLKGKVKLKALPGVELTHVVPSDIPRLARSARQMGAQVIVVHGETIVEPVRKGTNRMALLSDIDILAHPGFITLEEARLAKKRGIALEISGRKGHSFTNGYVARTAKKAGAMLVFDTDSHAPSDLMNDAMAQKVILGSGLSPADARQMQANSRKIIEKAARRK